MVSALNETYQLLRESIANCELMLLRAFGFKVEVTTSQKVREHMRAYIYHNAYDCHNVHGELCAMINLYNNVVFLVAGILLGRDTNITKEQCKRGRYSPCGANFKYSLE